MVATKLTKSDTSLRGLPFAEIFTHMSVEALLQHVVLLYVHDNK